ncbi:MAG: hypothetical protein E7586_00540 [Ruminococcaceae bacterium]|nr:hypothetical protein [Oscillospiraceae bacterium]
MKKRILCVVIALFLAFGAVIIRISRHYTLSCERFAETGIKGDITKDINIMISEKLNTCQYEYKEIVYKRDGSISQIEINTEKINLICNKVSEEIFNLICNRNHYYGIPIGNTFGSSYLSGKGPKLGVNIIPVGYVNYTVNSELISGGINQTLHKITATFTIEIRCLAPFHENKTEIQIPLVLSEVLIAGAVPEVLFPF